jgi:hypothetical protein
MGTPVKDRVAKHRERKRQERLAATPPDWAHVTMHLDRMPAKLRQRIIADGKQKLVTRARQKGARQEPVKPVTTPRNAKELAVGRCRCEPATANGTPCKQAGAVYVKYEGAGFISPSRHQAAFTPYKRAGSSMKCVV